jgi:transposase
MAEAYDLTFRVRAVAAYHAGAGGYHRLARLFGIAYRTLQRWVAQERTTGSVAPQKKAGGRRCPIDVAMLKAVVREAPDATVAVMCEVYNRRVLVAQRTNATSFRRALRRAGFVFKKNGRGRAKSTGRKWQPSAPHS